MNPPMLDHGPALTVDNLNTIAELTENGWTARQIADHLNIGERTVHTGRQIMGVTLDYHDGTEGQYIDEAAVLRAMWGERITLNLAERSEAIERLARNGHSHRAIAAKLHVTTRTVERHLNKPRRAA